jgi:hypothetical protein
MTLRRACFAIALLLVTAPSCTNDTAAAPSLGGDGGSLPADAAVDAPDPDGGAGGSVLTDGSVPDADAAGGSAGGSDAGAPEEPCPALTIPTSCFGREVMYREWGATATGDGTYFVDQAPGRLGFTRLQGRMWVVKFQLEANSYFGRISAYGDASGGFAWISRDPCDAVFAVDNLLATYGVAGGGDLSFVVVRDDADEAILDGDPTYAAWRTNPRLRGGHCYYVAFENATPYPEFPLEAADIETAVDECGATGDGTCYYLAMDFNHRLHDITSNQLVAGNVISGLTH